MIKLFAVFFVGITFVSSVNAITYKEGDGNPYSVTDATYINKHVASVLGDRIYVESDTYPVKKIFIKFGSFIGENAGQIKLGTTIISAKLHMYVYNESNGLHEVYNLTQDFDETTLKWGSSYSYDPTIITTFRPSEKNAFSIDVTDSVTAWLDENTPTPNYGWFIQDNSDDGSVIYSDDADFEFRPYLEIAMPIPEPTTIILCILGTVFAFWKKR